MSEILPDLNVSFNTDLDLLLDSMDDLDNAFLRVSSVADKETKRLSRFVARLERVFDPVTAATQRYERELADLDQSLKLGIATQRQYDTILKGMDAQLERTTARTNGLAVATARGSQSYRQMGPIAQQAGYQVADFAVQVGAGQNAMLAFTQQGSQLLGFFGPLGAAAGAALAVLGGLALVFGNLSDETEKATLKEEDYRDALIDTQTRLATHRKDLKELIRLKYEDASATTQQALATARKRQEDLKNQINDRIETLATSDEILADPTTNPRQRRGTENRIARLSAELDKLLPKSAEAQYEILQLEEDLGLLGDEAEETANKILGFTAAADETTKSQEKLRDELDRLEKRFYTTNQSVNDYRNRLEEAGFSAEEVAEMTDRYRAALIQAEEATRRKRASVDELAKAYDRANISASSFGEAASFAVTRALSSLSSGQGVGNIQQVGSDLLFGGVTNAALGQLFDADSAVSLGSLLTGGGPNLSGVGYSLDSFFGGSASAYGPVQPGIFSDIGAAFNFSTAIAGLGASFVSSALFGNGAGASLGSTAGSFLGTAGAGALSSTAIGATLGSALPVVGTIAGALLGGAIGSLFDEKPSNKEGNTIIDLAGNSFTVGGQEGEKYSQENRDASAQLARQIDVFGDLLTSTTGASLDGSLRVGVGGRDGIYYERGTGLNNTEFGYGNDTRQWFDNAELLIQSAFADIQDEVAEQIAGPIRQYVEALDVTQEIDTARVQADLALLQSGGRLFQEFTEQAGPVEQTMQQITAVFDSAVQQLADMADMGVDVSEALAGLNENLEETRLVLVRDFESNVWQQYLAANSPNALALAQLGQQRQEALQEAQSIGASVDLVNMLFDSLYYGIIRADDVANDLATTTERIGLLQSSAGRIGQFADSLLTDSGLSPLSPGDRLAEARSQFEAVARVAQFGTGNEQIAAIEQLEGVTTAYLTASRDYYASSENYFADFEQAQSVLRNTETIAQRELSLLEQQLVELQKISAGGLAANDNQYFGKAENEAVNRLLAQATGYTDDFRDNKFVQFAAGLPDAQKDMINDILIGSGRPPLALNTGGSFTVRGQAGIDANLVPLALTNGEVVNVSRQDNMQAMLIELQSMRAELQQVKQALAVSGQATVAAIREGSELSRDVAQATRRAGAV